GSTYTFTMDASALSDIGMSACDTVFVQYQADGADLVAGNVDDYGTSTTGDCGAGDGTADETGSITEISDGSVTLDTSDSGSRTFAIDPTTSLGSGFVVGDVVDVTYAPDPDGVTLDATDLEYVETDNIGVVSAVGSGSVTISDGITRQQLTFAADPDQGLFDNVQVGDTLDVSSHLSAGAVVVDNVDDLTADGTWSS